VKRASLDFRRWMREKARARMAVLVAPLVALARGIAGQGDERPIGDGRPRRRKTGRNAQHRHGAPATKRRPAARGLVWMGLAAPEQLRARAAAVRERWLAAERRRGRHRGADSGRVSEAA
jgi:hypothetical protein